MFKEILLPIDLNDPSSWKKALPVALQLVDKFGCKLHLMTVVPAFGMAVVGGYFPPDFEKKAIAAANDKLHEWSREHLPAGVTAQHIVAHGTVYEEIVETRKKLGDGLDLIVMASHRPDLKDYLIGPNAARVVRHAQVSVLIVRE
jgi:nucleotide-binding universal stress UspA family protein